jgi:hypothetical protein
VKLFELVALLEGIKEKKLKKSQVGIAEKFSDDEFKLELCEKKRTNYKINEYQFKIE